MLKGYKKEAENNYNLIINLKGHVLVSQPVCITLQTPTKLDDVSASIEIAPYTESS